MALVGRSFSAGSAYRYGFNGQEKSDEIGEGLATAMFWEYDTRIGRRWNLDPKPIVNVSSYSAFLNSPIYYSDPKGDVVRNADVAKALDKEITGQDLAGSNTQAGDYTIVPIQKSITDKTSIGYNAWRKGRHEYQLDVSDLKSFSDNAGSYAASADVFYASGTPDYNDLRYYYGIQEGDLKSIWKGFKGMWSEALHDPTYVATLATTVVNVGLNLRRNNAMQQQPVQQQQAKIIITRNPLGPDPMLPTRIANGCEGLALQVQSAIGGEFLQMTPNQGSFLGPVKYAKGTANNWAHHVAVIKNGIVYDGLTGSSGMPLDKYKTMFEYSDQIKFSQVKTLTVK